MTQSNVAVRRREITSVALPRTVMQHLALCFAEYGFRQDSETYRLTEKLVHYVIPPPYPFALLECLELIQNFNPLDCPISNYEIDRLREFWMKIPDLEGYKKFKDLYHPGSYFPLYNALRKFKTRLANHSATEVSLLVSFFLRQLSPSRVKMDSWFSEGRYYRDALSLRLCLTNEIDYIHSSHFKLDSQFTLAESILEHASNAIQVLDNDQKSDITHYKGNKTYETVLGHINTIIRLLSEGGNLGRIKVIRQSYTKGDIQIDSVSVHHSIDFSDYDEWGVYEKPTEIKQGKRNPERDDSRRYLQRKNNSTRTTVKDDLRVLRTVLHAIEARNTIAHSDTHRLPMSTLGKYLDYLCKENILTFWFAWLLFSLGLDPKRLKDLWCLEQKRPAHTCGVYFDSRNNLLTYDIVDGATDFESNDDNHPSPSRILQIALPDSFTKILTKTKQHQPFLNAIADVDRYSIEFKKHNTGIRPSAKRISASFWLHVAPYLNELVAANLCSKIPSSYRAQVNYYQFYLDRINQQWQTACWQTQTDMREALPYTSQLRQPIINVENQNIGKGVIGSQVAVPLTDLENLITTLNTLADAEILVGHSMHIEQSIEAFANFLNYQHMILYLEQQIVLFLRQVGKRASVTVVEPYGTWVRDKDSSFFAERRLNLHNKLLARQQAACLADFENFQQHVHRHSYELNYQMEQIRRNLALRIHQKTDPHTFYADVLTTSGFFNQLETLQLSHLFPSYGNVIRHINATELHDVLSQPFLDECMGHERGGMDIFSPYSSTNPKRYFEQLSTIEQRMNTLPFRLLRWRPTHA